MQSHPQFLVAGETRPGSRIVRLNKPRSSGASAALNLVPSQAISTWIVCCATAPSHRSVPFVRVRLLVRLCSKAVLCYAVERSTPGLDCVCVWHVSPDRGHELVCADSKLSISMRREHSATVLSLSLYMCRVIFTSTRLLSIGDVEFHMSAKSLFALVRFHAIITLLVLSFAS